MPKLNELPETQSQILKPNQNKPSLKTEAFLELQKLAFTEIEKVFDKKSLEIDINEDHKAQVFFDNKIAHFLGLYLNDLINLFIDTPLKSPFYLIGFCFLFTAEVFMFFGSKLVFLIFSFFLFAVFLARLFGGFRVRRIVTIRSPFELDLQKSEELIEPFYNKMISVLTSKNNQPNSYKLEFEDCFSICYIWKNENHVISKILLFKVKRDFFRVSFYDSFGAKNIRDFLKLTKKMKMKISHMCLLNTSRTPNGNFLNEIQRQVERSTRLQSLKSEITESAKIQHLPRPSLSNLNTIYASKIIPEDIFKELQEQKPSQIIEENIDLSVANIMNIEPDEELSFVIKTTSSKIAEYQIYASEIEAYRLFKEKKNEYSVFTRTDNDFVSKMCKTKMDFSIDQICDVLFDFEKVGWYNLSLKEAHLIKKYDQFTVVGYQSARTPLMVTERDFVYYIRKEKITSERTVVVVFSAQEEKYPPKKGYVRGIIDYSVWDFTRIENEKTGVVFVTKVNPRIAGIPLFRKKIANRENGH